MIQGETSHHEYINQQVSRAIMETAVSSGVPVLFGVADVSDDGVGLDRAGGKAGNKGNEAALAAIEMANLLKKLPGGRDSVKHAAGRDAMARRSKAREVVLQMLYQIDVNPDVAAGAVREMIHEQFPDEDLRSFAWSLFAGVRENRASLDARISTAAARIGRWPAWQRPIVMRCGLGAFELLLTDTPHRVVIDETIELARRFGTAQSPQFVNGILDRLIPPEKRASESRNRRSLPICSLSRFGPLAAADFPLAILALSISRSPAFLSVARDIVVRCTPQLLR